MTWRKSRNVAVYELIQDQIAMEELVEKQKNFDDALRSLESDVRKRILVELVNKATVNLVKARLLSSNSDTRTKTK